MAAGLIAFVLGLGFLLVDFGVWSFFGINWWTALLLLGGIVLLLKEQCSSCCDLKPTAKKKR
tara:strand:- start:782 stop:967 length:186 start_codon:yes stop_codon:yes gene_type:complete